MVSIDNKINDKNEDRKEGVDLDQILIDEIGQFGRFQVITLVLLIFPIIFAAFSIGGYVFTTARIPTRCRIPQCDGQQLNPEFRPQWVLNAIPGSSIDSFDGCSRYADSNNNTSTDEVCPAWWFNTTIINCDEYVYENSHTIVYEFDLGCNEWRRSQIGSISSVGKLIAIPLTGYVSDRWGRRVALIISITNAALVGIIRSFVNTYEWFVALEVLEAATGAGAYSACYILAMELVGPKYRVISGVTMSSLFATGEVILGFIAWGVKSWRPLLLVLYIPQFLIVGYFWIMSESIRWLLSKGRYDEAEIILKKASKLNNKQLSEKSMKILKITLEAQRNTEETKEPWLPILVIKSRTMLIRCIVLPIIWIVTNLIYYGLSINSLNMTGNQYLNYILVTAIEIPGCWTAIMLLDRVGRKPMLMFGFWLCATCQLTIAFLPEDGDFVQKSFAWVPLFRSCFNREAVMFAWLYFDLKGQEKLSLVLYLLSKYSIVIATTSTYVHTAELFPTKYRHRLFAFPSTVGRIGTIAAPLTPALASEIWESFPSVLFASFALLAGFLVFTTPETLGTKLPDTMEEAERIESRKIYD